MLVNLSDVLTSEGKVTTLSVPLEMTSFRSGMGNFRILQASPISFVITNAGIGKARIEGNASLTFQARCDRCLTEVPVTLDLEFDELVVSPDVTVTDEDADETLSFMEGFQLNVEIFVCEEILMNWPMKILCREDCKGVCPKCGKNRNEGDCGCDTFVPDPRMAAIQDIFNANKEV